MYNIDNTEVSRKILSSKLIAKETSDLFVPLVARLGLQKVRSGAAR